MHKLQEKLSQSKPLIMDGATGTQLQRLGLPIGMAPELWNLQQPDKVRKHHLAYVEAGTDAILTNSFGGTRPRLALEQHGHLVHEINMAAGQLGRAAAGEDVLVLGSVGPTGMLLEPMGELTYAQAVTYFAEQSRGLAEGGVDGIHIETMSDLSETAAAIEGTRQVTDLPITVTMSFDTHGRTMMGVRPEEAVLELGKLDVLAIGVNCGRTLDENLTALTAMRNAAPNAWLIAKPNAGLPRMEGVGDAIYDVTPEIMADYALRFARLHLKMLGACCGSTPAHITAMKEALAGFEPPPLEIEAVEAAAPARRRQSRRQQL